jgi:hypothetical protein
MSVRTLAPCPSSPNCVSTQAKDEGHAIAPIRYRKSRAEAKEPLRKIVRSLPHTTRVEEDESVPLPALATAIWASIVVAWSRCDALSEKRGSFIQHFSFERVGLLV